MLVLDDAPLAAGKAGSGRIIFWAGELLPPLEIGDRFAILEGRRVVGHGTVSSLV